MAALKKSITLLSPLYDALAYWMTELIRMAGGDGGVELLGTAKWSAECWW